MTLALPVLRSLAPQVGLPADYGNALLEEHRAATGGNEHIRVIPGHGWAIVAASLVFPVAGVNPYALASDDILALFDQATYETAAAIVIEHDLASPPTSTSDYQQGWADAVHHVEALLKRLAAAQHAHRYVTGDRGSRCTTCDGIEPGTRRPTPPKDGATPA